MAHTTEQLECENDTEEIDKKCVYLGKRYIVKMENQCKGEETRVLCGTS